MYMMDENLIFSKGQIHAMEPKTCQAKDTQKMLPIFEKSH